MFYIVFNTMGLENEIFRSVLDFKFFGFFGIEIENE